MSGAAPHPLPGISPDSVWPGDDWAEGPQLTGDPAALAAVLDPPFSVESTPELGRSLAFVAVTTKYTANARPSRTSATRSGSSRS